MDADLRLLRARGRLRRETRGDADGAGRLAPRALLRAALAPRDRTRELRALPGPRRDLDRDQAGIARRDPALAVSARAARRLVRRGSPLVRSGARPVGGACVCGAAAEATLPVLGLTSRALSRQRPSHVSTTRA